MEKLIAQRFLPVVGLLLHLRIQFELLVKSLPLGWWFHCEDVMLNGVIQWGHILGLLLDAAHIKDLFELDYTRFGGTLDLAVVL